jgi:hypothetical protein
LSDSALVRPPNNNNMLGLTVTHIHAFPTSSDLSSIDVAQQPS